MAGALNTTPAPSLTPSPVQATLPTNYINVFDFNNQYLPDTQEMEFERYGNRSVASFLGLVSAELPTNSDLIKWVEQGRLHTKYTDVTTATADAADTSVFTVGGGSCNFRVNQTVFLSDSTSTASGKGVISAVSGANFTVEWYKAGGQPTGFNASTAITAFVYGSEFKKGSEGMVGSLEADSDIYENKPIIIKDVYEVSGSDMAQIGWIEISNENGDTGYFWFLKSEGETRTRFEDYLEMSMVEAQAAENGSGAEVFLSDNTGGGNAGSEGMFEAIESRGNVWGGGNPETLADFDSILKRLDKQGSIGENVMFLERGFSLDFSDMVAAQNNNGLGTSSFGLFENDEDMALNLGFSGFKRGGYEFYQTDWKYLNDFSTRGDIVGGKVNGVLVPAGSMTVYDQVLGQNASRPFLHVRYRASQHTDRRMKSWVTGSEGGAQTNDIDKMRVDFLSERALITMGANNFVIFND